MERETTHQVILNNLDLVLQELNKMTQELERTVPYPAMKTKMKAYFDGVQDSKFTILQYMKKKKFWGEL